MCTSECEKSYQTILMEAAAFLNNAICMQFLSLHLLSLSLGHCYNSSEGLADIRVVIVLIGNEVDAWRAR